MRWRLLCNILSIYISNYLKYRSQSVIDQLDLKKKKKKQIESAYEIRSVVDLGFHVVSSTQVSVTLIVHYLTSFNGP